MNALTNALHDLLAADYTLTALLGVYEGEPSIFTTDPAPGKAVLPYIVSAGSVAGESFDTKQTRGGTITRDIRCYAPSGGSAITVEAIAERVRELLHRQPVSIYGYNWIMSECSGPVAADEPDAYGRIVTLKITFEEI